MEHNTCTVVVTGFNLGTEMILSCYYKGDLAWAELVESGAVKPDDDGHFTYQLTARSAA